MNGSVSRLVAGDLDAAFLPGRGMIGISLRHRGEEFLRRLENLEAAAVKGSTAGIPLLYPWANRLSGPGFRAAGRDVLLDPSSPLLHCDENGLPMHGVRWSVLAWEVTESSQDCLVAGLDWNRPELLAVFPFRHRLQMAVTLAPDSLTIETKIRADELLPVSFGFHPYFGIPGLPRGEWRLRLPPMRRLVLDNRGIPTGEEAACDPFDAPLGELNLDDGFVVLDERPRFSLSGGGRQITVEFLQNFSHAQVFAPRGKDFVALEPMTAPTSALTSGRGLRLVKAGQEFQAAFRILVEG